MLGKDTDIKADFNVVDKTVGSSDKEEDKEKLLLINCPQKYPHSN